MRQSCIYFYLRCFLPYRPPDRLCSLIFLCSILPSPSFFSSHSLFFFPPSSIMDFLASLPYMYKPLFIQLPFPHPFFFEIWRGLVSAGNRGWPAPGNRIQRSLPHFIPLRRHSIISCFVLPKSICATQYVFFLLHLVQKQPLGDSCAAFATHQPRRRGSDNCVVVLLLCGNCRLSSKTWTMWLLEFSPLGRLNACGWQRLHFSCSSIDRAHFYLLCTCFP